MGIQKNNLVVTHPDLMKEWDYAKNQGIDPTTLTYGSNIKVWWKCSKCGHEWQTKICERVRGTGCPNRKCRRFKENNITVTHPSIATEWHPTLNVGLDIETFTFGSKEKVWWKCSKCGHEWQAPIMHRCTRGTGCPKEKAVNQKSSQEYAIHYFLAKYTEVVHSYQIDAMELDCFLPQYNIGIEYDGAFFHDRKRDLRKNRYCFDNNIILYRLREMPLTSLNDTSIDIECLPNNKDLSRAISILIKKIFDKDEDIDVPKNIIEIENLREHHWKENSLLEKYPEIAAEWHPTKNGDLNPSAFSYGSKQSVWWKCSKCGHEWQARIYHRVSGSGCPAKGCRKYTHSFVEKNITITHPDLMKEWDYAKNQGIDPTTLTYGSNIKVWWKCSECGHEWQARIAHRVRGSGCPANGCRKYTHRFVK